jgi:hypothetical protein
MQAAYFSTNQNCFCLLNQLKMHSMKAKFYILIVLSVLVFISCNKQKAVPEVDFNYCGLWGSSAHSIEIWEDGDARWEKRGYSSYEGNVTISGEKIIFRVGRRKSKTTFTIDKTPYTDTLTGRRQMVLSGETFYKNRACLLSVINRQIDKKTV